METATEKWLFDVYTFIIYICIYKIYNEISIESNNITMIQDNTIK